MPSRSVDGARENGFVGCSPKAGQLVRGPGMLAYAGLARGAASVSLALGLLVSLSACPNEELAPINPCTVLGVNKKVTTAAVDKVDVLFVVDNSRSMLEEQQSLARELPEMVRVLATGDIDGDGTTEFQPVSSLHLGVVSTDMGVAGGSIGGSCTGTGGDGRLLSQGDPLDTACAGQSYPLYLQFAPGDDATALGTAFSCISRLGTDGCGLEQQLDAALKALVPSQVQANTSDGMFCDPSIGPCPGTCGVPGVGCTFTATSPYGHGDVANAGFIQEDSVVAVIVVTDEDDCSIPDTSAALFQLSGGQFAGIPINLRCYEQPEYLYDVERYAQGLRGLRSTNPDLVIFAAITGVPQELVAAGATPEQILAAEAMTYRPDCSMVSADPNCAADPTCKAQCFTNDQAEPQPSCQSFSDDGSDDLGKAYPPRRIVETVQKFGDSGVLQSICQEDFGPALDAIIAKIADQLKGACLPNRFNPNEFGLVECDVIETVPLTTGCARPGRTVAEEQPDSENFVSCVVDQVAVRQDSLSEEVSERLVPNPQSMAVTGWYYDNFSAAVKDECESTGDVQRISFTNDAPLPAGATIEIECFSPAASAEAKNVAALGTLSCANTTCDSYEESPELPGPNETVESKPFTRDWLYVTNSDGKILQNAEGGPKERNSLICEASSQTCMQSCRRDSDCANGWVCEFPVIEGAIDTDRGYCVNPTCPSGN